MSAEEVDQDAMIESPAPDHGDGQGARSDLSKSGEVSQGGAPEATEHADEVDQGSNREAAKYRRRLRNTEAERDRLADQLATARKAVVEAELDRLPVKLHPDLIWMRSAPGDYFTEDGTLNRERLQLIVDQLRQLGAAQVKGWNSGEGREPKRPVGRSARDRATKLIMGRLDE